MKRFKYLILLIILIPLNVLADENNISIECPSNISKGNKFTCEILGLSTYGVCAVEYEFILPDNISKVSFKVDNIWQGYEEDNLALLYTDEDQIGVFPIGIIELIANEDIDEVNIETKWLLYGDSEIGDHILIDKDNGVNETQENSKINENQENINKKYVIIISIIVILIIVVLAYIFIIKRKK